MRAASLPGGGTADAEPPLLDGKDRLSLLVTDWRTEQTETERRCDPMDGAMQDEEAEALLSNTEATAVEEGEGDESQRRSTMAVDESLQGQ